MDLIIQNVKKIMEECKEEALRAGLYFGKETLEYIVTNRDLLELSSKMMIPDLYDYWVHDVNVLKRKGIYEIYPSNPYETVINTRPAISFYNDNNPDWLNRMIFHHVLAHIDFFQNNIFFKNTWNDDFCGQALSDKRVIAKLREEKSKEKRWVDYIIEFSLSIDNLVGYYRELEEIDKIGQKTVGDLSTRVDFYFGNFLRKLSNKKEISALDYTAEVDRYNDCLLEFKHLKEKEVEDIFFMDSVFKSKHPEFPKVFEKFKKKKKIKKMDLIQHLMEHSDFLNKEENKWMKEVMQIVRETSLFFQPQIRTKIFNEGWASYWHEKLFIQDIMDGKVRGHEVDFARIDARVAKIPRVGINPYGLGRLLLQYIEEMARKGKFSLEYQLLKNQEQRKDYDKKLGEKVGTNKLFELRRTLSDFQFINFLTDEDFQDFVTKNKLFVVGTRVNLDKRVKEYYVKSRKGEDYRRMINRTLYHPPCIKIKVDETNSGVLSLDHVFEGRTLITDWIEKVMRDIEFLWRGPKYKYGGSIKLETTEFEVKPEDLGAMQLGARAPSQYDKVRCGYVLDRGVKSKSLIEKKEIKNE